MSLFCIYCVFSFVLCRVVCISSALLHSTFPGFRFSSSMLQVSCSPFPSLGFVSFLSAICFVIFVAALNKGLLSVNIHLICLHLGPHSLLSMPSALAGVTGRGKYV